MPTQTPLRPASPHDTTPRPQGSPAGPALLGTVLVVAGVLWLLAALGVDLPVGLVTPVVLLCLGIVVTVSAVRGEDGAVAGFAVVVGVWLSIFALVATVTEVPLTGAVGDVDVAPTSMAELDGAYRLFAGTQRLDLRDLTLEPGTTVVSLSTVLGELEVRVPADMAVRVDAGTAAGAIDLDGVLVEGVGLRRHDATEGWGTAGHRLDLELRVGLGQVRVRTD